MDRSGLDPLLSLAEVVAAALDGLAPEAPVRVEMNRIRRLHAEGRATAADRRRYCDGWRYLALRRSRRCAGLGVEVAEQLGRRSRLMDDIRHERARHAVDAVFRAAPEGEAPAAGAGTGSR